MLEWFGAPHFWVVIFVLTEWIVRISSLIVIPARRSPAAAKNWLFLIFLLPWPGVILFWFLGGRRLPRGRQELLDRLWETSLESRKRLEAHPNITHPDLGDELDGAVRLAENLGRMPILGGNKVELLVDCQGIFDRLVEDIDAAQNHVHLLFYIFEDDAWTQPVIDALCRAVARGVKCRVLVDSLGSRSMFDALEAKLKPGKVELHELLPVGWFRFKMGRFDMRNHRKIAVIDGHIGYTGSMNLVDPHFKPGIIYEELMVRVTGPVVLELQYVFVCDWFLETEENLESPMIYPDPDATGDSPAQGLPSGPGFSTENNQRLFVSLLHSAHERIVITTPYFIPDEPFLQALQTAVLRGVEVHLIVSYQADQILVSLAQKSYYTELLEAGVKVHLYQESFLHAKHLSIDDTIAVIGSSNMDIRSFELNAEFSLIFYDPDVASRLHHEEERYIKGSVLLDADEWAERPLYVKTVQRLGRLFSPLL